MEQSVSVRFKRRLRQLRKLNGWTQEVAAERCGIGYKLMQLYELGIKRNPGLLTLEKICRGFEIDISEFFDPRQSEHYHTRKKLSAKSAKMTRGASPRRSDR